ncbi:MAG: helix-turn-helix domain containing protein [Desulfocapsaceae bacterium]|nr:helix-turn-helix domain containing protein [Desulfocapsaceae bacterium]
MIERPQNLPPDLVPEAIELPGDLAEMAMIIDGYIPGLGVEITMAIAQRFRGTYVFCHNLDALWRAARDRRIVEFYDDGMKVPEIARLVGLGQRRVWDILGKPPEDDRQMKLF